MIGDGATGFDFQVGPNNELEDQIQVTTNNLSGMGAGLGSLTTNAAAAAEIDAIDAELTNVATDRALYGAVQNRSQSVISNLQVASENQAASRGRIMDADFAMETANLTRFQILQQAGTAMVAQANVAPQVVLSLLQ